MRTPKSLPGPLRGRSFTLTEAESIGVLRHRTRCGDLHTPSRGIRVPWDGDQDLTEILRPIVAETPGGVVSHSSAALLWGIPLPPWLTSTFDIHITRAARTNPPRRIGVVGHHSPFGPGDVRLLRGLPLTSPLRTWLDLSGMLSLDDLVAAGDFLVCEHHRSFGPPRNALVPVADIKEAVFHEFHRRGIVNAREASKLIRVGADSPPETQLRLLLERAGLPEFTLNHVVKDFAGRDASWPDLAVPEWRVAVEYDGGHHRTVHQKAIDDARDHLMAQLGWRQVRISHGLLASEGEKAAVVRVKEALRAQGWSG